MSADSPAWAAELSMATDSLMRRIGTLMGDQSVRRVKVRSRGTAPAAEDESAANRAVEEGGESLEVNGKLGEDIRSLEDEEMRKALSRLARASSTSRQSEQKDE